MNTANPRRNDGDNKPSQLSIVKHAERSRISPLAPTPGQARHWAKVYRTEIAAGSSSVLSTFVAVCAHATCHVSSRSGDRLRFEQYPLDSVKTRMQAYDRLFATPKKLRMN